MRTRWHAGLFCLALGLCGCAKDGRDGFALRNPFQTDRGPDPSSLPPASTLAATRVNAVGSAVVAKVKDDLGAKPVFFTMGVPEVEISHNKSGMVILSEGLVERCPTDTELAAVICHELGKMAAERGPDRTGDREPVTPRLTHDVVGGTYEPDMTRMAEEAKFDRRSPRGDTRARDPRPDPRTLAENFLVKAGYKADDYARMEQILREADDNADRRASERGR
jgi:predicted Zn-dependent protease